MKRILLFLLSLMCLVGMDSSAQTTPKIRFGVTYFYPPFVFSTRTGYVYGLDIDTARAICRELKAECSFTPTDFAELFPALNQNKFDAVMGAISITPERQKHFDFTRPYLKSSMNYVSLAKATVDPANLQGKRVGTVKNSTFEAYLRQNFQNKIHLVTYQSNEHLVAALSNKEVDVILIDSPAAHYWVGYSTGLFKIVGSAMFLNFDEGYAIAVKKGNRALANQLNQALNNLISNGTFDKIKQNYFKK